MTFIWKPGAPCSKDVAKHTIYGEYFVIICALENVGLRTPLSRENMKIQNIINLYAYRSRMCSLEKFRGDVNSHDLLHNLNISSYTLLLRMSTNPHTRPHWQTGSHPFHGRPKDTCIEGHRCAWHVRVLNLFIFLFFLQLSIRGR